MSKAAKAKLLNRLSLSDLKELASENKIILAKSIRGKVTPLKTKSEIVNLLKSSNKITAKKIYDKLGIKRMNKDELLNQMNTRQLRDLAKQNDIDLQIKKRGKMQKATTKEDILKVISKSRLSTDRIRSYLTKKKTTKAKTGKPSKKAKPKKTKPSQVRKTESIRKKAIQIRDLLQKAIVIPRLTMKDRERQVESACFSVLHTNGIEINLEPEEFMVLGKGYRPDAVTTDKKIALEFKVISKNQDFERLNAQISAYKHRYPYIVAYIHDIRRRGKDLPKSDIRRFEKDDVFIAYKKQ